MHIHHLYLHTWEKRCRRQRRAIMASPIRPRFGSCRGASFSRPSSTRLPAPPIANTLTFRLVEVGDGFAAFEGDAGPHLLNPLGMVHGGWALTLIDSAAAAAHAASRRRELYQNRDEDQFLPAHLQGRRPCPRRRALGSPRPANHVLRGAGRRREGRLLAHRTSSGWRSPIAAVPGSCRAFRLPEGEQARTEERERAMGNWPTWARARSPTGSDGASCRRSRSWTPASPGSSDAIPASTRSF